MSNINPTALNQQFPLVGRDNDSQGFRDNFAATNANFKRAYDEISALQTAGVFTLDPTAPTKPYDNNLQNSIIHNGSYYQLGGVYYNFPSAINSGTLQVNLNNGPVQKFTIAGNTIVNFISWQTMSTQFSLSGIYSTVRLILVGDGNNSINNSGNPYTLTVNNSNGNLKFPNGAIFSATVNGTALTVTNLKSGVITAGQAISGAGIPNNATIVSGVGANWTISASAGTIASPIVVNSKYTATTVITPIEADGGKFHIIDAFSYDGGANVFIRSIGDFL